MDKKVYIITNFNPMPYLRKSINHYLNMNKIFIINYYNDILIEEHNLNNAEKIIIFLRIEEFLYNCNNKISNYYIELCDNLYNSIKKNINKNTYWVGFSKYDYTFLNLFENERINKKISSLNENIKQKYQLISYIDLENIQALLGYDSCINLNNYYRFNSPYTQKVYDEILDQIGNYKRKNKKYLFIDCDNVLWLGIISENDRIYYLNDNFGKLYYAFQNVLRKLYNYGIILFIVSKNYKDMVLNVLNRDDFLLSKKHFLDIICNFDEKVNNINHLLNKYNINKKDALFIDDDIYEIKKMNNYIPDLDCIQFDENTIEKIKSYFDFSTLEKTKLNKNRLKSYKVIKKLYDNNVNYHNLIKHVLRPYCKEDNERLKELILRCRRFTNRGNHVLDNYINNYQYSINVILSEYETIKFGIVSYFVIDRSNNILIDICVSCRIMSNNFIEYLINILNKENINKILFIENDDNTNFKTFLENDFDILYMEG